MAGNVFVTVIVITASAMLSLYLVGGLMIIACPTSTARVIGRFRNRWLLFNKRSKWEPSPGKAPRMLHVIMFPEHFSNRPQLQRIAGLYYLATAAIGGSIVAVAILGLIS